jgi:cysteine-S-conjugate beta-lyase
MWVADMDFPIATPITEAIKKRAEHEVYGYTQPFDSVIDSVVERTKRRFGWEIKPEWVVFTPGVVPALHAAVKAFTHPGDQVIIQEPVYHPFSAAVTSNGCHIVDNQLQLKNGRYEIDFDSLQRKFSPGAGMMSSPSRIQMMLMCNPHNPVGRVWTKEELVRMGEIIIKNDAIMVADEIHCELLFAGQKHIPFASISDDFARRSIVCMAPSKTFNLAGLKASSIIIPDKKLRDRFNIARMGILPGPNVYGFVSMEAAYNFGDEWLEQLLAYLQKNLDYLVRYFEEKIPRIKVIVPEGTYLVWLDCREMGMSNTELQSFFRLQARVGLEDGFIFGAGGAGFERMNIACPLSTLEEALSRIAQAVNSR